LVTWLRSIQECNIGRKDNSVWQAHVRATLGLFLMSTTSQSGFSFLLQNTAAQDTRFRAAFRILIEAIDARAFPACSIAVTHRGELVAHKAFGRFRYEPSAPEVTVASIFDLASLTKVVATTAMAMILYERGVLDLEAPVTAVVPEFAGADVRRAAVTFRMLLAHSSGLPAYEKLFVHAREREDLLRLAFATQFAASPGSHAEYSDIGFIILGVALERLADERLDSFCQREIFGPLAMSHMTFNPPNALRESIPPTADDRTFRHRIIQGEVQAIPFCARRPCIFSRAGKPRRKALLARSDGTRPPLRRNRAGTLARDRSATLATLEPLFGSIRIDSSR
jgi:CubicO group peptidase (beta-lactamase class C family)